MDYVKAAKALKALGHPTRLQIAVGVAKYGCHVNKIVQKTGLPQSTVSQHLANLRNSGVLTFEKKGQQSCYRLVKEEFNALFKTMGEIA